MLIEKLRSFHGKFYEWKKRWERILALKKTIAAYNANTILFIMTPIHGNIGDHAIAKAASDILADMGLHYIEITSSDLFMLKKLHAIGVMNGKPIIVNGGGNLGTLWPKLEKTFRCVIKNNLDSKILCLPNTIYYDSTSRGKHDLDKSVAIYNSHKDLTICARERISYELVSNKYNHVVMIPDLVLSMNESKIDSSRKGCLLCLRNDKEKTLALSNKRRLVDELNDMFPGNVRITDTDALDYIPIEERNTAITNKLEEFRSAELVVTDRLHGMVFSAITGTPCIVLNSKSHKIKGCYEWVKDLEYIVLAQEGDQISELYGKIPKRRFFYDNVNLQPYFYELKRYISDLVI